VTSDDQIEIEAAQIENELVVQVPSNSHYAFGQASAPQTGQTSSLGLGGGSAATGQQLAMGGAP
jgi:hypothetical protein